MNKVVCDLCGTSYPETATQCPICGCVRPADAVTVNNSGEQTGYVYVKGGRFSKSNVKKRNQTMVSQVEEEDSSGSNKKFAGLLIVLISLIVIIAFMVTMILITWKNRNQGNTEETKNQNVACEEIQLSQSQVSLSQIGEVWMLSATIVPADCTDSVSFSTSDPNVVTVSNEGKITCVGEGEAIITVKCGQQQMQCTVVCEFEEETTIAPTIAPTGITLNRMSITFEDEGYSWKLYNDQTGDVPVADITWISDDPSVATFINGEVTAVAEGKTMVHAEYNGIRTSCEIICDFNIIPDDPYGEQEGETTVEYTLYTMYNTKPKYNDSLKAYDITLSMKEGPVGIFLRDNLGNKIELEWTIVEGTTCTVNGTYVKVNSSASNCKIKAEYNGVIYMCYIRTVN